MIGKQIDSVKFALRNNSRSGTFDGGFVQDTVVGIEVDLHGFVAQENSLDQEFAGWLKNDVALAVNGGDGEVDGINEDVARLCLS